MRPAPLLSVLLPACLLVASCSFRYDTVNFVASGTSPRAVGPAPDVGINTHIKVSSLLGGTIKSRKPYSIDIGFTDKTFTYAKVELTKVTVTYRDGTSDPGVSALKLPLHFPARPYESEKFTSEGTTATTKVRLIAESIPGAITRDLPFTLRLEGKLIKDDGSKIPFTVKHEYNVEKENYKQTWVDFVESC